MSAADANFRLTGKQGVYAYLRFVNMCTHCMLPRYFQHSARYHQTISQHQNDYPVIMVCPTLISWDNLVFSSPHRPHKMPRVSYHAFNQLTLNRHTILERGTSRAKAIFKRLNLVLAKSWLDPLYLRTRWSIPTFWNAFTGSFSILLFWSDVEGHRTLVTACITHSYNGFLDSDPWNPYDAQTYPILRSKSAYPFEFWLKIAGITSLLAVRTRCSRRNSARAN
jgi:hypothetical protein